MPQVVHKYPLAIFDPATDRVTVPMPWTREILCVQMQAGVPCVWARVDPESTLVPVVFAVVGTGHPLPADSGPYVGTVQLHGGALILHVFGGV